MIWSEVARLAAAKSACHLLDGGTLCLYAGDVPVAELRFSDPAFHGDALGSLAPDESSEGSGTVDSFAAKDRKGQAVATGSVGKLGSGADVEMKLLNIPRGARVEVESLRFVPGA